MQVFIAGLFRYSIECRTRTRQVCRTLAETILPATYGLDTLARMPLSIKYHIRNVAWSFPSELRYYKCPNAFQVRKPSLGVAAGNNLGS